MRKGWKQYFETTSAADKSSMLYEILRHFDSFGTDSDVYFDDADGFDYDEEMKPGFYWSSCGERIG